MTRPTTRSEAGVGKAPRHEAAVRRSGSNLVAVGGQADIGPGSGLVSRNAHDPGCSLIPAAGSTTIRAQSRTGAHGRRAEPASLCSRLAGADVIEQDFGTAVIGG
jgi:hypothetical protein